MKIIIRCEKCGKVLRGKAGKGQRIGRCPRCMDEFVIPSPVRHGDRKQDRVVISENNLVRPIPETFTHSKEPPVYRVLYTEVSPVEFALKRSTHVPLLDLSEGGMGILVRADEISDGLLPGDVFIAELDFPILVQSIFIQVEVHWIRPIKEEKLLHIGVRFCNSDKSFKGVFKNLMKYISSKTETLDFDKWGSFG
jgi:phage FluMu protein Com